MGLMADEILGKTFGGTDDSVKKRVTERLNKGPSPPAPETRKKSYLEKRNGHLKTASGHRRNAVKASLFSQIEGDLDGSLSDDDDECYSFAGQSFRFDDDDERSLGSKGSRGSRARKGSGAAKPLRRGRKSDLLGQTNSCHNSRDNIDLSLHSQDDRSVGSRDDDDERSLGSKGSRGSRSRKGSGAAKPRRRGKKSDLLGETSSCHNTPDSIDFSVHSQDDDRSVGSRGSRGGRSVGSRIRRLRRKKSFDECEDEEEQRPNSFNGKVWKEGEEPQRPSSFKKKMMKEMGMSASEHGDKSTKPKKGGKIRRSLSMGLGSSNDLAGQASESRSVKTGGKIKRSSSMGLGSTDPAPATLGGLSRMRRSLSIGFGSSNNLVAQNGASNASFSSGGKNSSFPSGSQHSGHSNESRGARLGDSSGSLDIESILCDEDQAKGGHDSKDESWLSFGMGMVLKPVEAIYDSVMDDGAKKKKKSENDDGNSSDEDRIVYEDHNAPMSTGSRMLLKRVGLSH